MLNRWKGWNVQFLRRLASSIKLTSGHFNISTFSTSHHLKVSTFVFLVIFATFQHFNIGEVLAPHVDNMFVFCCFTVPCWMRNYVLLIEVWKCWVVGRFKCRNVEKSKILKGWDVEMLTSSECCDCWNVEMGVFFPCFLWPQIQGCWVEILHYRYWLPNPKARNVSKICVPLWPQNSMTERVDYSMLSL